MTIKHPLLEIVENQKRGIPKGIYSACSANEYVIEAVLRRAKELNEYALIEATANQVNQFGGYTGMRPEDFKNFVFSIAKKISFPENKIILGGDHLGPLTWKEQKAEEAMEKSIKLVREYVKAGFTKIHIDTSMHLGDDAKGTLATSVIAERGAILCKEAEKAFEELKERESEAMRPVYIVGSEVPIPGGSQDEEEGVKVTTVEDFNDTVQTFKEAFHNYGIAEAWSQVIAVVVQPGVEFGDESIHEYNRKAARDLTKELKKYPNLVFEGHSTDYQTPIKLKHMVEDGVAILKVGPALTFALREGLFALSYIESELFRFNPEIEISNLVDTIDTAMARNPENWEKHYHGAPAKIRYARKYSYSDRCRYYLPMKEVQEAIDCMIKNLKSTEIPLTLIKQFMPVQYNKIRSNRLKNDPEELLKDRIINCIDDYIYATIPDYSGQSVVS